MKFIALTPAALLRLVALATEHDLTEDEACALVRALHADHPHGIVPLLAVEAAVSATVAGRDTMHEAAAALVEALIAHHAPGTVARKVPLLTIGRRPSAARNGATAAD